MVCVRRYMLERKYAWSRTSCVALVSGIRVRRTTRYVFKFYPEAYNKRKWENYHVFAGSSRDELLLGVLSPLDACAPLVKKHGYYKYDWCWLDRVQLALIINCVHVRCLKCVFSNVETRCTVHFNMSWCCAKCCENAVDIDLQSIALNWLFLSLQRRTEVCYCELSVGINRSLANHIDRCRTLVPAGLGSTLAPGRCVYKTWLYVISLWWRHIPICSSNAFGFFQSAFYIWVRNTDWIDTFMH